MINFWPCAIELPLFPGHWLVEQFLHIYSETADQIWLKFGGLAHCDPD